MKSQLLITLLVSLFVLLLARDPARYVKKPMDDIWTNCTAPGGHMSINSVTIIGSVGNVIKVGQNITVIVEYSLDEDLDDGSVIITTKTMGVDMHLCQALLSVGIQCPILKNPKGIFNVTQTIPNVPEDTYNIKVTATDTNDNPLICVHVNVQIKH